MIQDLQPSVQALLAQPTLPTTSEQAAPPSKPHRSLSQAENDSREGTNNRSNNAGSDPSMLPCPPTPAPTTAVALAAPAHTRHQSQAPFTMPAILRPSLNVHMPTAPDPWVTSQAMPYIKQSLRQAGHSSSVADKLTRAVGLLAAQGVLQMTQSAGPEPGARSARATGLNSAAPLPSYSPWPDGQGNSSRAGTKGEKEAFDGQAA